MTRVLFVGNSFTYFHNLPALVAAFARPRAVSVGMAATGGAELRGTWPTVRLDPPPDQVVLQEQSTLGNPPDGVPRVQPPERFHAAVRAAVADIRRVGAEPVLYLTWARRDTPAAQDLLDAAYYGIGAELAVRVAPVGPAWRQALTERPDVVLHDEDDSHPSALGSYLAACVLYATLFRADPRGVSARVVGQAIDSEGDLGAPDAVLVDIDPDTAAFLQDIAWRVTQ